MTTSAATPPDAQDVRRLIDEARAVIAGVDRMVADAPDPQARSWAEFRAASARRLWQQLVEVVTSANADMFDRSLDAIVAITVPIGDAPDSLAADRDSVSAALEVLASDVQRTFWPLQEPPSNDFSPQTLAAVGAALRSVGPGLA